jgi:transposase
MEYGAIDLHKVKSEVRILDEAGAVRFEGRIVTSREAFARVFGGRGRLRVLLESGTESEWVAQCLEALGHEVIVADPNFLPMYGMRSRRVKTDRRDVAALAEACRTGTYRRAHRVSAETRDLRRTLQVRRQLVQMRSQMISRIRAMLRQEGLRLPNGSAETVVARLTRVTLPPTLTAILEPLRQVLETVNAHLALADAALHDRAVADAAAQRLLSAPGVGPVIALSYLATLETPARFGGDAGRASAFLGLVPSEASSAERRHRGHITKAGPRELRALLVQASWTIWRSKSADGAELRRWAQALAARRGRRVAIVALARRLSRILYALWRDDTEFVARRTGALAA